MAQGDRMRMRPSPATPDVSPHAASTLPPPSAPPRPRWPAEGVGEQAERGKDAAAAAAMLPAELLQPSEIIILLLKPSPWFIVLAPLRTLVVIALVTLGAMVVQAYTPLEVGLGQREIVLLGVGVVILRLFWQFLEWLSRVYVLTDQRVIRVMGVIRISVFESALMQIQNTSLSFRLRERLFGLGTLSFATAGTGLVEAHWVMVDHPLEVHQKVVQTLRRYRR